MKSGSVGVAVPPPPSGHPGGTALFDHPLKIVVLRPDFNQKCI